MDMQSLIEKSHIGHWMKRSGKTFDDLDKYEKYEYEQTIKLLKITTKQFDMVNSSKKTPMHIHHQQERDGAEPMRYVAAYHLSKENQYRLMPVLLDKIIDLGLDIGISFKDGVDNCFGGELPYGDPHDRRNRKSVEQHRQKLIEARESFRDLTTQNTSHNDLTMYVELAERIRDVNVEQVSLKRNVNTEIFCIKEEFKLEIERNKATQDRLFASNRERWELDRQAMADMGSILSRIEKQEEKINKQADMTYAIRTSIVVESEDTSSLFTDVNTEIFCIKEEFKLEIERNKALQDKGVVDINNLLSTIENQDEKINKQTEMINVLTTSIETKEENIKSMIICNRIVFGVFMIVYITIEIYKNYNFGSREDVCQLKQITHN